MTATDKTYGRVGQSKASMVEWDNLRGSAAFLATFPPLPSLQIVRSAAISRTESVPISMLQRHRWWQFSAVPLGKKGSWTAANAVQ
jgi:hypothetical protein